MTIKKIVLLACVLCLTVGGVLASWNYPGPALDEENDVSTSLSNFSYGIFYITRIEIVGGSYASASVNKTHDTNISADITLNKDNASTVVASITFYNSAEASYYYNETQTVSTDNSYIGCTVTGIEQKEEIPAHSYKTITATFGFTDNNTSKTDLLSEIHFNFALDKDSIGIVVAQSAVTKFEDILNDTTHYSALSQAMSDRGSNASTVSYIGNVAGADDSDSNLIKELFTSDFLTMDLDGDGKSEPITMMIKRENLDNNTKTGDDYSYKNFFGSTRIVEGAEMTLYITSEGFDSSTLTVYASTFTKLEGSDEWIQVVPLTKGTASANNYSTGSFGTDNSFNTDTWKDESGNTIDTLTQNAMNAMNIN